MSEHPKDSESISPDDEATVTSEEGEGIAETAIAAEGNTDNRIVGESLGNTDNR